MAIGEPSVDALVAALRAGSSGRRAGVVEVLRRIGSRAVPHLIPLLQHADPEQRKKLRKKAASLLKEKLPKTSFLAAGATPSELAQAVLQSGGGVLVIDAENELLQGRTIWQCVQAVHCPLLVVR